MPKEPPPKGPPFNCFSCCPEQLYTYFEWLHELCNYVNCCIDSDLCFWYLRKSKPETLLPAGGKGKGKGRRGRRSTAVLTQVLSFLNASWSSWCGKNIYGWMLHRGWIGIFGWCEVQSISHLCSHRCSHFSMPDRRLFDAVKSIARISKGVQCQSLKRANLFGKGSLEIHSQIHPLSLSWLSWI